MEITNGTIIAGVGVLLCGILFLAIVLAIFFRKVVSTNDVHIVQSARKTVSYGKDQEAGNTYYAWPSWVPIIGIKVINLPVSVFSLDEKDYEAYDKDRVPFLIHVMAFFRIDDPNTAAQRVHSFGELKEQLTGILRGASRSILAKNHINEILEERSKYGALFTEAVEEQLKAWGVSNVKAIELMDIRDAKDSKVIHNIMAKKQSHIEMDSRKEVAKNLQEAQQAEINAKREVALQQQQADQAVGERTAQKEQAVGIAQQQAEQAVKDQEKVTAEKTMAVIQVQAVRKAEIDMSVQVVAARQDKETTVIKAEGVKQVDIVKAEGTKQQTILVAEGDLEKAKRHAEGVRVEGDARGAAETALLMAPVNSQITLAREIGTNAGYQTYLVSVRTIEANQVVGVAQAEALKAANIKVIATSGDAPSGVKGAMEILTAKGGTQLGAMLEGLAQTDAGKAVIDRVTGGNGAARK